MELFRYYKLFCFQSTNWTHKANFLFMKLLFSRCMPLTSGCVLCLPLLKAELPPPYTAIASPDAGGVPVINCRVCQSLINLDGKLHQHVVKCTVCNEATVSRGYIITGVDKLKP